MAIPEQINDTISNPMHTSSQPLQIASPPMKRTNAHLHVGEFDTTSDRKGALLVLKRDARPFALICGIQIIRLRDNVGVGRPISVVHNYW